MTPNKHENSANGMPSIGVDVVEAGKRARRGRIACEIDGDLTFSTSHLESYCLAQWEPVVFDALVVAAAIEFCDRSQRRHTQHWGRAFELRIPVHDPDRWSANSVSTALKDAVDFLTGIVGRLRSSHAMRPPMSRISFRSTFPAKRPP